MKKILTSPSSFGQISSEPFDLLLKNGFSYINNPYGRKLTEDEVIELASDCVGIVAGVEPFTKRVMDSLPNLKCISRVGVGMDSIDLDYAKKKSIKVINTPYGPTRSVAEFTISLTLSLLKKIPQSDSLIRQKKWKKQLGNQLLGKKIGVIGLGKIGCLVAELFLKLGNNVIGYDINPNKNLINDIDIQLVKFDDLISNSDIITIHVPGSDVPLITTSEIEKMKNNLILINVSRGGVVEESDLYNALKNKRIYGAAVDVFENEPYSGPLTNLNNIILTPHIASYAKEGKLKMEIDSVINLINTI